MDEIVLNKQVSFSLNGIPMTGTVIRLGESNSDYVVVRVKKEGKRELECWVKKENIEST
jgi:hypothetical protein